MSTVLPFDIFRVVFRHVDARDIMSLRQVCREFYDLTKLRSVWTALLHKHVLQKNIPIPGLAGKTINDMVVRELENGFRRALSLRRNWISESPAIARQFNLEAVPTYRVVSLHFLPEEGNRRFLSLSMSGQTRKFVLQCWDLHSSPTPICIARREMHNFGGMAVNKCASGAGIIAVRNSQLFSLEILSLDYESKNIDQTLVVSTVFQDQANTMGIHYFSGSTLLTRNANKSLLFWDINRPDAAVRLQNPHVEQDSQLLEVIHTQDFLIALRPTTLELYHIPSDMTSDVAPWSTTIHPIATFTWPWLIDTAIMTERNQPTRKTSIDRNGIFIFIRFGSYYPWAINILHHYEISVNYYFSNSMPVSSSNLPYNFPPMLQETISSPVRLHATSDLTVGPYGTAIWIDSHTEDYFFHADRGQRLAGRLSPYIQRQVEENDPEEVELSNQRASASATSVYSYHEQDSWIRIALDEREGRIIIGRDDGVIQVLEYV